MLVKGGLHLLLVAEDAVEAGGQFGAAFAVENYLSGAYVAVRHALVVHEVQCAQNLLGQVFED